MNTLLEWLEGGDLRSDGVSSQAAETVLKTESLISDLAAGLSHADDVVRGRTMDALEKIARSRPDLVLAYLPTILDLAKNDQVMMVRMHAAMIFGHLAVYAEIIPEVLPVLLGLLEDKSTFTKSWAITSLCIIARKYPQYHQKITAKVISLEHDPSTAIRTRVRYAMEILTDQSKPFPKGWVKSEKLGFQ